MSRLTEQRDVQDQLVNHLQGIGWTYLPPLDCARMRENDEREPFLPAILREQLGKLNGPWLDPEQLDEAIRRLRILPANLDGNERYLAALRGRWTAYDPAHSRERNLVLVDYDDPRRNTYHFTQEMWFQDRDRRRLDMVLWANGLPVLLVENKSPRLEDPGDEGFRQVQETYTQFIPEFVKYPMAFAVGHRSLEYGATWNPRISAFYRWKAGGQDHGLEALSKSFFDRAQVLRLLRDYTIFYRSDDATRKFLLRPHQMRAAQKIVERVVAGLAGGDGAPRTGLEWHTQGSGKTLTLIVAAHLLRREPALANPTLLAVVDRVELEQQMVQNLESFGFPALVRAGSRRHLRRLLEQDYRGLIVTTIHKFDRMPEAVCDRPNVVALIDEAHRTQEGDLGTYMRAALPHAFTFGFTGTPIDRGKVGRGTFELFGRPDPEGYHDKYSIAESIADGTTVPLYYTLAPTDVWVDKPGLEGHFSELRDEFFALVEEEGVATQEALSRLLQRAEKLLAVLKAPPRVDAIAQHVAGHFQANVRPRGFKALLVSVDREACALYKQALDRYLPPAWSTVVYSPDHNDPPLLKRYHLDDDQERRVRQAFRDPDQDPRILIVTEKLLTGYDAPLAYCMYLDKPLKDHTLLQAIARVNRPYPDKQNGLIVDYMGVFEDLQKALTFDQATVRTGLIDLALLQERFAALMDQAEAAVAPVAMDQVDGRVERALAHFFDPDRRQVFFALFQDLQDAYEILSPDPCLRPYLERYAEIAGLYAAVYGEFSPKARQQRFERRLLQKTDTLIRAHVGSGPVAEPLPLYPINRNLADVVRADDVDEQVKVINLQRTILAHIEAAAAEQPYLLTIGEAVERIIEQLQQRQISVQTALEQLQQQAGQVVTTQEERARSSLDSVAFSLRMVLRGSALADHAPADQEQLAQELAGILDEHDGWPYNQQVESRVRMLLYRRLLPEWGRRPRAGNAVAESRAPYAALDQADLKALNSLVEDLLRMHRTVVR